MQSGDIIIRTERTINEVIYDIYGEIKLLREDTANEFKAIREEMANEFKAIREETAKEFKAIREEMANEFKAIRSETANEFKAIREEMNARFDRQQEQISELKTEVKVANARIEGMQYTLTFFITAGGVLIAALPLIWMLKRVFSGSLKRWLHEVFTETAREVFREEFGKQN